jgi:hypothetical protein
MKRRPVFLGLALVAGCGAGPVAVRQPPADALRAAEARLVERGIVLDSAGRRADALRTERYCYVPPDAQGNDWGRSLIAPYRGPFGVPGAATLTATGEWWRLAQRRCEPVGNPLVGRVRCEYGYDGAVAPQAIEPHFHAMFSGL